ncbi:MAG TPA: HlyD family efflux transporter periplasmic adaptor subunit, partial [Hellea balneolensis]|nr:HlyD family efflux transporter periplasmic adaptor subunit [Hellea balneolensis]
QSKGRVTAPADARVTEVSVVKGSTVSPGQVIARLATLDGVVRLALPERHAGAIHEGEVLTLRLPARGGKTFKATITKIYPELKGGAVIADARVVGRLNALVGERVDVLVAVGRRRALLIPKSYVTTRYGIDFVKVHVGDYLLEAPVTLADPKGKDGQVEVLAGLHDGDIIESPEAAK